MACSGLFHNLIVEQLHKNLEFFLKKIGGTSPYWKIKSCKMQSKLQVASFGLQKHQLLL